MVSTILPFETKKLDINKPPKVKKRCTAQLKIAMGIAVVLGTLVIVVVLAIVCGNPNPQVYFLPHHVSDSKLGIYQEAAVSSDAAVCATIGRDILWKNGSAVDAAIATSLCMGAVNPQSSGIGGGFLMTFYDKSKREGVFLDAREVAPLKATENMFEGNATKKEIGPLSIAVPGEIAGYYVAHQKYGRLAWKDLFEPTIRLCREGINVTGHLALHLKGYSSKIKEREHLRKVFVNNETGEVYQLGDKIRRPDLADTFEIIARDGKDALYNPKHFLAASLLKDLKDMGSIIEAEDLRQYEPRFIPAITTKLWSNFTLHSASISGSGSLLAFILNLLDGYNITAEVAKDKESAVLFLHRMLESFKFAYSKRRELEDDLKAMEPILELLINKDFANVIRRKVNDERTYNNLTYYDLVKEGAEEDHGTAHLCVIAPNGDAVALTTTINVYFGSLEMSPSTGILLNDEMDDFSSSNITSFAGVPPSESNRIHPKRRPMSSMCPTVVVDSQDNARLAIGGNGGTKITTGVLQVMMRNLYLDEDVKQAIDAPRFHHQLLPNVVNYEVSFPKELLNKLEKKGHELREHHGMFGIVMAIARGADGKLYANADFRKKGDVDGF